MKEHLNGKGIPMAMLCIPLAKPKTVTTRMGDITFYVLQVLDCSFFYIEALEKGLRSEWALTMALA